jgi:hypothetical protein
MSHWMSHWMIHWMSHLMSLELVEEWIWNYYFLVSQWQLRK